MIEKEVAEAQIKAQLAQLAEEKEVLQRHRLSAELLAQLSDKVREWAGLRLKRGAGAEPFHSTCCALGPSLILTPTLSRQTPLPSLPQQ